jgi:hypothetical protein
MAQHAGFTLAETRTILQGAGTERPLSTMWRRLAGGKLVELADTIRRLSATRSFLEASLRCGCMRAEECEVLAAMAEPTDEAVAPQPRHVPGRRVVRPASR